MRPVDLRRPRDIAVLETPVDETGIPVVYVAPLPHGPLVVLRGTASLIWQEAQCGSEAAIAERVAARLGNTVPAEDIADEVAAFVEDLVGRGLLERQRARERG